MCHLRLRKLLGVGVVLLCYAAGSRAHAGGSGLNTVVVINQSSSNSCALGNYYCERRQVPPGNVLYLSWSGTNTLWTSNDFQINLLAPLLGMLRTRGLTNQVDYIVLSMDIPFQTVNGATVNSTTSALFYGLRSDSGDAGVTNSYAASEAAFDEARPASAPGYSFLTTMITANSLAQAEQLVDQGVASDGTFPKQPVVLAKSSDPVRNIRYPAFDNAIFNVRLRGLSSILNTNTDSLWSGTNFLGYETGLATFAVPAGAFIPGAIADSLSSFGGVIFGPNDQTTLLAMIAAGASGSYGTVAEPGTDPEKFPDPQVYFYQARGFNLAESYYQSLSVPYLGLMVADPLAAPFAQPGGGWWLGTNMVLSGVAPLSVQFSAVRGLTLRQVDLFVDGEYWQTLTNVPPSAGNLLNVSLNGYPVSYVVPTNASLGQVATGLAAALNAPEVTNLTQVIAIPHGDRVELQALSSNWWAAPLYFDDTVGGVSNSSYRVTYLPDTFPPQLSSVGLESSGAFRLHVDIATTLPYIIEASTNLSGWLPIYTNAVGGLLDFTDPGAATCPKRFYRVVESVPDPQPWLSLGGRTNGGSLILHIDTAASVPYAVEVSTNLSSWTALVTNQPGGPMDFVDSYATNAASRFYRTWILPTATPTFAVLDGPAGDPLVRVDDATRPFVVQVSTNQTQWLGLVTNYVLDGVQTIAGSSRGSADALTTFLGASGSRFLNSGAFGRQQYVVLNSSLAAGAYLQLRFTKTNGAVVTVGLTNQTAGGSSTNFASQLYGLINATPALQGADGVVAQDFNLAGSATFNLCARAPGWLAAGIAVALKKYGVMVLPSSPGTLTANLGDLRPRNHLYVTAGAGRLSVTFPLDTTTLADGYHELTAVAYEGSDARTQTRATLPVVVQNTALTATMTLLDLPTNAPVQGSYHIQVTATNGSISAITLYSTGGALGTVSNQSTTTFPVNGPSLGVGLHPFYAIVQDPGGNSYRTATQWVRLISGP